MQVCPFDIVYKIRIVLKLCSYLGAHPHCADGTPVPLCRGMATEMGIKDFSTAVAWKSLALEAINGPPPLVALINR